MTETLENPWGFAYGLGLGLLGLTAVGTIWADAAGPAAVVLTIVAVLVREVVMIRAFSMGAVVSPTQLRVRRVLTTRSYPVASIEAISVGGVPSSFSACAPRVHSRGKLIVVRSLAGYGSKGDSNSRVMAQARTMAEVLGVDFHDA